MLAVLVTGLLPEAAKDNSQHDDRVFVVAFHRQLARRLQSHSPRLRVFISDMMHSEPEQRLTASQVLDAVDAIRELQLEEGDDVGSPGCAVM